MCEEQPCTVPIVGRAYQNQQERTLGDTTPNGQQDAQLTAAAARVEVGDMWPTSHLPAAALVSLRGANVDADGCWGADTHMRLPLGRLCQED